MAILDETYRKTLRVKEAAQFLGVKEGALRVSMMRRQIPFYKTPTGSVYLDRDELEAWMRSKRVPAKYELDDEAERRTALKPILRP